MAQTSKTATSPDPAGVAIDGAQVRKLRKLGGRTVTDLAESCGISVQYLSLIERGERATVSPPVFVRICDALGIREDDRRDLLRAA